jgi:hypothetical protein
MDIAYIYLHSFDRKFSPRPGASPPLSTTCTIFDSLSTQCVQDDSSHSIRGKAQREVALHQAVAHLPSGTHLPQYAITGERTSTHTYVMHDYRL